MYFADSRSPRKLRYRSATTVLSSKTTAVSLLSRAERFEDLKLHARIGNVVFAADDVRDAEVDVVDDAGEGIEIGPVGTNEHGIG